MDIGTPERYLKGTFDIIEGNVKTAVQERLGDSWLAIEPDAEVLGKAIPPAVLESGVKVAPGAHVGSLVVLGADVSVGAGSTVERAVVLARDRDRRALRAARLHRRPRMPDRRRQLGHRRRRARRRRQPGG